MRLVLRRVVSGYIEARYDALLPILWHVNYRSLRRSLSIPRAILSTVVREHVCLYPVRDTLLDFLRWIALCGTFETGTLDQPIRRLMRARPLTLKSPRAHIPA